MSEEEKNVTVKQGNPFIASFKGTLGKGLGCFTIIVIVIIVIAAISSGGKNKTQKVEENTQTQTTSEAKSEELSQQEYKVGDTVKLGDREFVVNTTRRASAVGYSTPKSGKEFVIVNVTIRNLGKDEVSYNPFDFKMQDINGAQESEAFASLDDDLSSGTLASNGKVTGSMAFEVPTETSAKLIFQPSFWSKERVVVAIEK